MMWQLSHIGSLVVRDWLVRAGGGGGQLKRWSSKSERLIAEPMASLTCHQCWFNYSHCQKGEKKVPHCRFKKKKPLNINIFSICLSIHPFSVTVHPALKVTRGCDYKINDNPAIFIHFVPLRQRIWCTWFKYVQLFQEDVFLYLFLFFTNNVNTINLLVKVLKKVAGYMLSAWKALLSF